jgi:hypothetical protein
VLGPKAIVLCLLPGWRGFMVGEMRTALGIDAHDR